MFPSLMDTASAIALTDVAANHTPPYKPTEEFTPNDFVVCHCSQSLEIVDAGSEEIFGVGGK